MRNKRVMHCSVSYAMQVPQITKKNSQERQKGNACTCTNKKKDTLLSILCSTGAASCTSLSRRSQENPSKFGSGLTLMKKDPLTMRNLRYLLQQKKIWHYLLCDARRNFLANLHDFALMRQRKVQNLPLPLANSVHEGCASLNRLTARHTF